MKERDYEIIEERFNVNVNACGYMKNNHDIKAGEINKLIPNLLRKKNSVVHYRNLKHYLSKGWILIKVHRILEFKQSPWMKPYIDFNREEKKHLMKLIKAFLNYLIMLYMEKSWKI